MADKHPSGTRGDDVTAMVAADAAGIARICSLLKSGGIAAVPTETVYGLAARADDADAVAQIYRAKGRPDFNPLIVHVPNMASARRYGQFDDRAEQLARDFWPGPLTLVLPLQQDAPIAPAVTAGLPTIALRVPAHPTMRAVLSGTGLPLAAPSANRSGRISPTSAAHVRASLDGRITMICDGGTTEAGVESTIVALRDSGWSLLRPGPVTREMLVARLGPPLSGPLPEGGNVEAPGQLASHYAPGKPVRLNAGAPDADEFFIGFGAIGGAFQLSDGDLAEAASRLYEALFAGAASDLPKIAIAPIPEDGIGQAINDRLRRAAA